MVRVRVMNIHIYIISILGTSTWSLYQHIAGIWGHAGVSRGQPCSGQFALKYSIAINNQIESEEPLTRAHSITGVKGNAEVNKRSIYLEMIWLPNLVGRTLTRVQHIAGIRGDIWVSWGQPAVNLHRNTQWLLATKWSEEPLNKA